LYHKDLLLLVSRTGFYVRPRNVIVPYFKGMTEAVEAANEKTDKVCLKTKGLVLSRQQVVH